MRSSRLWNIDPDVVWVIAPGNVGHLQLSVHHDLRGNTALSDLAR